MITVVSETGHCLLSDVEFEESLHFPWLNEWEGKGPVYRASPCLPAPLLFWWWAYSSPKENAVWAVCIVRFDVTDIHILPLSGFTTEPYSRYNWDKMRWFRDSVCIVDSKGSTLWDLCHYSWCIPHRKEAVSARKDCSSIEVMEPLENILTESWSPQGCQRTIWRVVLG